MTNKNHKISGQVSLGIMVVGSLVGLGLLTAAVFNNSSLSFQNKNNLLAQVASTGTELNNLLQQLAQLQAQKAATPITSIDEITKLESQIQGIEAMIRNIQAFRSRVFITSANYSGNLGGLAGADSKCQTAANSASLGGTWKAWLSDSVTSASSRLEHSFYPYQLLNGATIANNWTDLTDGTLAAPINYTEKKTAKSFDVYTNTTVAGGIVSVNLSNTCQNWTSLSGDGYFGGPSTNSYWTDRGLTYYCGSALALYCVEQLGAAAVTPPPALTPSISITATSGSFNSQSSLRINVGDLFTISGTPQNLSSGFSRSFVFDSLFNNSCTNNSDSEPVWTIKCVAQQVGTGNFQIEIYQNGQTYRSNVIQVAVATSTITPSQPPYIKVLSPNGGESWELSNTYQVKFQQSGLSNQGKINLVRQGQETGTACLLKYVDFGKDVDLVDVNLSLGCLNKSEFGDITPGNYKVNVYAGGLYAGNVIQDSGDAPFTISAPTATTPAGPRVFITSSNYTGNLGGLAGADNKCQTSATNAGLGGNWKAWLSDSYTSASSRLEHSSNPYKLLNGTLLANNWTDLTDGTLATPINYTETKVTKNFDVYTNTTATGERKSVNASQNCRNWTENVYSGYFGGPATDSSWTDKNLTYGCNNALALYCVEQLGVAAVTSGTLSVALNTQGAYQIVTPGQIVTLAELKFSASDEDVAVRQLSLIMSDGAFNSPDDLVNQEVTLWDGADQVGTASFSSGDRATGTISGFTVPKDGSKVLRVKGKIAGISVSDAMNRSGEFPKVDYDGGGGLTATYGVGQSFGQTINPTGGPTKSTGVRIMKAYPSLDKISLTTAERTLVAGDNRTLYKFKVTANNGDVSIAKFSFSILPDSIEPYLIRFKLYAFTDSAYSVPDTQFNSSSNPAGLLNCLSANILVGNKVGILPSDNCSSVNMRGKLTAIKIPSGETRYFRLSASIDSGALGWGTVNTQLKGDAGYPIKEGMQSASSVDGDTNNDFIWSPISTTTNLQLSTNDWTNGYGVPGLPSTNMTAETLSASGSVAPASVKPAGVRTITATPVSPATACDATAKAVLDLAGGCSQISSSQYPSVYRACCGMPSATSVTKETILGLLNSALGDGRIDESEKADLLRALNDYLL